MVFRNDGQCFLVLEGKEIGEFSSDHLIGGFREGIPFMTVIDIAERQVETSLQQEITNRCTQLDARAATESPIKLLLDRQLMLRVGTVRTGVGPIQVGVRAFAQGESNTGSHVEEPTETITPEIDMCQKRDLHIIDGTAVMVLGRLIILFRPTLLDEVGL